MMLRTIAVFLSGFCLMLAVSCTKSATLAPELIGTWITQAPRYEGKSIEINESGMTFGTGTGDPTFFFIKKIKKNKIGNFVEWTFHCTTTDGTPTDIVLFYTKDKNDPHFELRNNRQVQWVKQLE